MMDPGTSFGEAEGGGALNLKNSGLFVFLHTTFFFISYFAPPPQEVGQNFAPPWRNWNDDPGWIEFN